jgi:CTP:phosphocholine cytidylyltransferase-like protein
VKRIFNQILKIVREEEQADIVIVLGHADYLRDRFEDLFNAYDNKGNPLFTERNAVWGYEAIIAREVPRN